MPMTTVGLVAQGLRPEHVFGPLLLCMEAVGVEAAGDCSAASRHYSTARPLGLEMVPGTPAVHVPRRRADPWHHRGGFHWRSMESSRV
jgi:hypothetical protein